MSIILFNFICYIKLFYVIIIILKYIIYIYVRVNW